MGSEMCIRDSGIVHVSAKDLGTGKAQNITITSSTNMSEDDIQKAVQDAEKFAAEDKKQKEQVEVRNGADQMVYQAEKLVSEMGDKVSADEKANLQSKIDGLKETLKGDNTDEIKAKQEELQKVLYDLSAKLYQQAAPQGQPGGEAPGAGQQPGSSEPSGNDDVVDVDYTEVDDKDSDNQ